LARAKVVFFRSLIRNSPKGTIVTFVEYLKKDLHIALVGNPNCGKSSLFNCLTGLKQNVGNFPGVTVDKLTGTTHINDNINATITDLPGTYSLYPKRSDEWIVYQVLLGINDEVKPDVVVLVADSSNLKRNLLYCSQIIDLKMPVVVALTMMDIAKQKGIKIDIEKLEIELGVPVVVINPRKNLGIANLKKAILLTQSNLYKEPVQDFVQLNHFAPDAIQAVKTKYETNNYKALQILMHHETLFEELDNKQFFNQLESQYPFNKTKIQAEEILLRFGKIKRVMSQSVVEKDPLQKSLFTQKLDNVLLHRFWGYIILLIVLFFLFQSIFWLAQYPMDWVETGFAQLSGWLADKLPNNTITDLFINGIVAGLGGILVFVPQIAILFALITLLEDSGYMARISFLTDRVMRSVGLNGKSTVPMISGFACAVPAIMGARNIENKKERLLTILVTPFMSCSARLPVYSILISLVIPNQMIGWAFSLQGLVMLGLYLLGVLLALGVSYILSKFINIKERSFFILELPIYRSPRWGNIVSTMFLKSKVFVFEAGKIIMIISVVLWFLSSFGPSHKMSAVTKKYEALSKKEGINSDSLNQLQSTDYLENSFAGILGKKIEPAIKPLGYDWKIGIALITSFAAREVFVGTMATLYSVGEDDQDKKLTEKMRDAKRLNGAQLYNLPTGVSLMIFYALAMQCMSTLAIVKRETKSWKWPILQFLLMTGLAYILSYLAYIFLS
jgi:ferrous iron transport protein B